MPGALVRLACKKIAGREWGGPKPIRPGLLRPVTPLYRQEQLKSLLNPSGLYYMTGLWERFFCFFVRISLHPLEPMAETEGFEPLVPPGMRFICLYFASVNSLPPRGKGLGGGGSRTLYEAIELELSALSVVCRFQTLVTPASRLGPGGGESWLRPAWPGAR